MPGSLLTSGYREFVLNNAQSVQSAENTLRSISYILPGRFKNSEILSEALYATVSVMSLCHDAILSKEVIRQHPHIHVSSFNKYTQAMLNSSLFYKNAAITMTFMQAFEVVSEMVAIKIGGNNLRSKVVLGIESAKALLRLLLIRLSGDRMLLHSHVMEREFDPSRIQPPADVSTSPTWTGKRTGTDHLTVETVNGELGFDSAMKYLISKALKQPLSSPIHLVSQLKGWRRLGEYVFILRPLIYAFAVRRYGYKSYKPWILSLVLELLSFSSAFSLGSFTFNSSLTELEKKEMKRRVFLFVYYILRNPFYDQFTKNRLTAFCESVSKKPLISILGGVISDYKPLWEKYHFYVSGI